MGTSLAFAAHYVAGGAVAALVREDGGLSRFDAVSGAALPAAAGPGGAHGRGEKAVRPSVCALSPDGGWLAVGDVEGATRVWAAASGQLQQRIKVGRA